MSVANGTRLTRVFHKIFIHYFAHLNIKYLKRYNFYLERNTILQISFIIISYNKTVRYNESLNNLLLVQFCSPRCQLLLHDYFKYLLNQKLNNNCNQRYSLINLSTLKQIIKNKYVQISKCTIKLIVAIVSKSIKPILYI